MRGRNGKEVKGKETKAKGKSGAGKEGKTGQIDCLEFNLLMVPF